MNPTWRSSIPAYDPTPQPMPSSSELCANKDCTHVNDWPEGAPPPALIWRGPGCYRAWVAAQLTPLNQSAAVVEPPTERTGPPDLPWLGADRPTTQQYTRRGDRAS